MIKKLLIILSLIFLSLSPSVQAADLTVSPNSDFSNPTTNFSAGQTIYVKISADSDGSKKHEVHLKDNQSNTINTYNMESAGGNQFRGSLSAPQNSGYYSLEARIESEGSVTSSTKTIKVGETNNSNSNVKVHVNVNTSGQNILGNSKTSSPSPIPSPTSDASPTPDQEESTEPSPSPDESQPIQKSFFEKVFSFFDRLFVNIFR